MARRREEGETGDEVARQAQGGPCRLSLDLFRSLENLCTFHAGRCHDLISPFWFKILLGPVCRMCWTVEEAESDMGVNDFMAKCPCLAHSRPSICMLAPSGRKNQARRKDFLLDSVHLGVTRNKL